MPLINYKFFISGLYNVYENGGVSYTEAVVHQPYALPTATTDEAITLGGVTTGSFLYIKSDQTINLNINNAAGTDIAITANKPAIITGTSITAIYLSNSSGSTANVYIVLLGV